MEVEGRLNVGALGLSVECVVVGTLDAGVVEVSPTGVDIATWLGSWWAGRLLDPEVVGLPQMLV